MKDFLFIFMMICLIVIGIFLYIQMDAQRKQLEHIQEAWVDANEITNDALAYYVIVNKGMYEKERVLDKIQHDPLDSPVHDDVKQLFITK